MNTKGNNKPTKEQIQQMAKEAVKKDNESPAIDGKTALQIMFYVVSYDDASLKALLKAMTEHINEPYRLFLFTWWLYGQGLSGNQLKSFYEQRCHADVKTLCLWVENNLNAAFDEMHVRVSQRSSRERMAKLKKEMEEEQKKKQNEPEKINISDGKEAYERLVGGKDIPETLKAFLITMQLEWQYSANMDKPFAHWVRGELISSGLSLGAAVENKKTDTEVKSADTKAFEAFDKAANGGYDLAKYSLGLCYLEGKGVTQNVTLGLKLLTEAANNGVGKAQLYLARSILTESTNDDNNSKATNNSTSNVDTDSNSNSNNNSSSNKGNNNNNSGSGSSSKKKNKKRQVTNNDDKNSNKNNSAEASQSRYLAINWLKAATDVGLPAAKSLYAELLCVGVEGVEKDEYRAIVLALEAAIDGDAEAPSLIAGFYVQGSGVPKDNQKALKWDDIRQLDDVWARSASAAKLAGELLDDADGIKFPELHKQRQEEEEKEQREREKMKEKEVEKEVEKEEEKEEKKKEKEEIAQKNGDNNSIGKDAKEEVNEKKKEDEEIKKEEVAAKKKVVEIKKKSCETCGCTDKELKRCSRCKQIYYCSTQCQKDGWLSHKKDCAAATSSN